MSRGAARERARFVVSVFVFSLVFSVDILAHDPWAWIFKHYINISNTVERSSGVCEFALARYASFCFVIVKDIEYLFSTLTT